MTNTTFTVQVTLEVTMTPADLMPFGYGDVENPAYRLLKETERQIRAGLEANYAEVCADWKAHHQARQILYRVNGRDEAAQAELRRIDGRWGTNYAPEIIRLAESAEDRRQTES